jgi:alpha-galactosidase
MEARREEGNLSLILELPSLDFTMYQGEEIDLPAFIAGAYEGDLWAGSNALRRAVREELSPRFKGAAPVPQIIFQGMDGMEIYQNESYLTRESRQAAELGIENFVLDAGWYHDPYNLDINLRDDPSKTRVNPWPIHLGDWKSSRKRFPSGLRKFADHVKKCGMNFGLWCEGRVTEGAPDFNEYQDILLKYDDNYIKNAIGPFSVLVRKSYLVDFGKKRGEDYYVDLVSRFVEEYDISWFWLDFNTRPRTAYWDYLEEKNRRGILELRYFQGYYRVLDRLRAKYPDLWIENCASGGRTIDFGTLKRSHSYWISDFTAYECVGDPVDQDICRNMRSGISKFLPAFQIQSSIFIPKAWRESEEPYPLYNYLCHFAGSLQYGQGLLDWKEGDLKTAAYVNSKYRSYRSFLQKDYYQLVPIPADKKGWDGWQFDDPETGEGILILFRMEGCENPVFDVPLHRIANPEKYRFETVLGNGSLNVSGGKLYAELKEKKDAMLVHYGKLKPGETRSLLRQVKNEPWADG